MNEESFLGSLLFSGVAFLNWFTKSSKFEEGFNDNELSWSCSRSLYCMMLLSVFVASIICCLIRSLKEKLCYNNLYYTRIHHSFEDTCNLNNKFVTFKMNPKLKEVTLNSFIFAMDILFTNPGRKFGMIDVTHEV